MTLTASCHCGNTRLVLPAQPTKAARCNCTFCQRTGAVWAYYAAGEIKVERADEQRDYSTNPAYGSHHFCGTCGMHTWGESIDWEAANSADAEPGTADASTVPEFSRVQVNLNLIDDLDWTKIEIEELDGRNAW